MKSFSQFLQESYIEEEQADQLRLLKRDNKTAYDLRKPIGNRGIATDPTPLPANRRLSPSAPEAPKEAPGQQVIRQTSNPPTTRAFEPGKPGGPLAKPIDQIPDSMAQGAYDAARRNPRTGTSSNPTAAPSTPSSSTPSSSTPQRRPPAANTTPQRRPPSANPSSRIEVLGKPPSGSPPRSPGGALALRPQGSSALSAPTGSRSNPINIRTNLNVPGRPKIPGLKSGGAISAALGTADEKMSGSGWLRSLAKGATVGTGAVLGGLAGGAAGTAIAPGAGTAIGGFAGQAAGAAAAEKAFDTVAGANAVTRKAMATANRQRQAGSAIKGIGGPTSFSQRKPGGPAFMSTGVGKQRKTVQLARTGVVNRGGKSTAGYLAFKNGQAVYKAAPSAQSLAQTSSNWAERVGRSLFAGAYKKHDAAKAQQALQRATRSDMERSKKLGVKYKPGG